MSEGTQVISNDQRNINLKSFFLNNKKSVILKQKFFYQSEEVVFRSFTEILKLVGKKYYPVRGKKIDKVIQLIKSSISLKITLGNCIIKKVNKTVIVEKEW